MLTLKECLDYCDLDVDEVTAVAEHEHIPPIVAAELCFNLLQSPQGVCCLHGIVLDDLQEAIAHGEIERIQRLTSTYQHLQETHPMSPG
jgi:hypothetical protein